MQYQDAHEHIDVDAVFNSLHLHPRPVILLEGTRQVRVEEAPTLGRMASLLAHILPRAVFRSGNAQGADHAFFSGLAQLPAERREVVLPYPGSGAKRLLPSGRAVSLVDVPAADLSALTDATLAASPDLAFLVRAYLAHGRKRHTVAAMYLLRDYAAPDRLPKSAAPLNGYRLKEMPGFRPPGERLRWAWCDAGEVPSP